MTEFHLVVGLYGQRVGLLRVRNRSAHFSFDEEYRHQAARPVLGLRLEESIHAPTISSDRLPAWFANLLPEGDLADILLDSAGVSAAERSSLDRPLREATLLDWAGTDLPGAVEVVRQETLDAAEGDWPQASLDEAQRFSHPTHGPEELRFSVSGVGLKFSMLRADGRFTVPIAGARGDWIVKLSGSRFPGLAQNEYSMMKLAERIGITVPEIVRVDTRQLSGIPTGFSDVSPQALAVRRFDRTASGKVHIEDLAQVRGLYPEQKYSGGFETVANLVYRGYDTDSLLEFTRRLAFNLVIGNGDAHLKNWSLIYADRVVPQLSPAYDLVSIVPYRGQGYAHDFGLRLANRRRYPDLHLGAFTRMSRLLGVPDLPLESIAEDVVRRVCHDFDAFETEFEGNQPVWLAIRGHVHEMARQLLE